MCRMPQSRSCKGFNQEIKGGENRGVLTSRGGVGCYRTIPRRPCSPALPGRSAASLADSDALGDSPPQGLPFGFCSTATRRCQRQKQGAPGEGAKAAGTLFCRTSENRASRHENLFNFFREHEIVVTDAFYTVRGEVDYHFVPDIEPFGVVVHRFGNKCDASHITEGRDEILAFVFPVQLAVSDFPAGQFGKKCLYFGIGQFLCRHDVVLQKRG